jgi:hypothetical protein
LLTHLGLLLLAEGVAVHDRSPEARNRGGRRDRLAVHSAQALAERQGFTGEARLTAQVIEQSLPCLIEG